MRDLAWVAGVLVLLVATQTGALVTEVYNEDETAFMLMARDVLDGHLPYTYAFDVKPPAIFLVLAGAMALFGESLATVRLTGDAFLFATAMAVYVLGRHLSGRVAGGVGALVLVALTATKFTAYTDTTLVATTFTLWATVLVALYPRTGWALAGAGLLVSLATLTRTNHAFVVVVLGLVVLAPVRHDREALRRTGLYIAGGLAPLLAILLVYAAAGALGPFRLGMIDSALAYAGDQKSPLFVLRELAGRYTGLMLGYATLYLGTTMLALAGAVLLARRGAMALGLLSVEEEPRGWAILVATAVAGALVQSILLGGQAYFYYVNQLTPFIGLLAGVAVAEAARARWTA
ncbi:MAG: glycosyltransferase family 39 protein, partial [Pseudomonadota bacterium]